MAQLVRLVRDVTGVVNVDPATGIRFGFGYVNENIPLELVAEEWATFENNVSFKAARQEVEDLLKDALEFNKLHAYFSEGYLDGIVENMLDHWASEYEENDVVYEYVTYADEAKTQPVTVIEYHSADNSYVVKKSPYFTYRGLCSPCAPNGGQLETPGSFKTYCLSPEDFTGDPPYPIYNMDGLRLR